MTNQQRVYTEVMVEGDCWHVPNLPLAEDECLRCKCAFQEPSPSYEPYDCTLDNPDLTTPDGAFWLLQRLPKWDRFEEFILFLKDRHGWYGSPNDRVIRELLPWLGEDPALYNALCEFMDLEV